MEVGLDCAVLFCLGHQGFHLGDRWYYWCFVDEGWWLLADDFFVEAGLW